MRKKHTFLLTIIPAEEQTQQPALGGRLEFISTGDSYIFTNLQELQQLIVQEIQHEGWQTATHQVREEIPPYSLRPPKFPEVGREE